LKRIFINNQIRAREVRLIDETGKQLGVLPFEQALNLAKEKNLDLIQVTERGEPPVCKIGEYGKYLYQQQKKERKIKQKGGGIKTIRLTFGISDHDLEIRAKTAEKFLERKDLVKIEVVLRGREKALQGMVRGKVNKLIEIIKKAIPIKVEKDLKRDGRGLTMIISRQ